MPTFRTSSAQHGGADSARNQYTHTFHHRPQHIGFVGEAVPTQHRRRHYRGRRLPTGTWQWPRADYIAHRFADGTVAESDSGGVEVALPGWGSRST